MTIWTVFLIAALAVVVFIGVPFGIWIGRSSKRTSSTPAASTTAPVVVNATAATTAKPAKSDRNINTPNVAILAILMVAAAILILWFLGIILVPAYLWFAGITALVLVAIFGPKPIRLGAGLTAGILLITLGSVGGSQGIDKLTNTFDRWINHGEPPSWWAAAKTSARTVPTSQAPDTIQANKTGVFMAPTGMWSVWLEFPTNRCVFLWGEDPNGSRFETRYMERNGDIWRYTGGQMRNLKAISAKSLTNRPEKVYYQVKPKTGEHCPKAA